MYGLRRDFVQNGGTFMVLDRPEGLLSNHLSQVQLGMIRSSRIPHFLPLHTKEVDLRITLEYNITGKKMLSQALKSEKLSLTEFYGLLLQITTALNDGYMYMLRPEQYILDESYMFIEGPLHLGKLYMTYVPLDKVEAVPDQIKNSIKELITRLMSSISELRGNGVQAMMNYCSDEGFNLDGLKRLLIDLLANEAGQGHPEQREVSSNVYQTDSVNMVSKVGEAGITPLSRDNEKSLENSRDLTGHPSTHQRNGAVVNPLNHRVPHDISNNTFMKQGIASRAEPIERKSNSPFPSRNQPELEWDVQPDSDSDESKGSSSFKTYWLLGGLLATAVVWRFLYLNNPSGVMLAASIGCTAVLGAVSFMGWKGKFGKSTDLSEDDSDSFPMFDSMELEPPKRQKHKGSRLQVNKLSEWFTMRDKAKDDDEAEPAEEWRWPKPAPVAFERPQPSAGPFAHRTMETENEEIPSAGEYYNQLSNRTEVLSSAGDGGTVLLQPKGDTMQDEAVKAAVFAPKAFLKVVGVSSDGVPERVELSHSHFIIGRSAEVCHYVSQIVGTSRAHVEVSRGAEGYMIKDLGSKNGTILKGEPMVPYKEYPLQEGDTFLIAGGKYTFHAS